MLRKAAFTCVATGMVSSVCFNQVLVPQIVVTKAHRGTHDSPSLVGFAFVFCDICEAVSKFFA